MNLFIIESPFQLFCAQEALRHFSCKENQLVILYSPEYRNNAQIKATLEKDIWKQVSEVYRHAMGSLSYMTVFPYIQVAKMIYQIRKNRYEKLFIGEYRTQLMHIFLNNLQFNEAYLLDDGTATIIIQSEYFTLSNNELAAHLNRSLGLWKKMLLGVCGLRTNPYNQLINIFSIFDLSPINEEQKVIKNDFSFYASILNQKVIEDNYVYFLGGNWSEEGIISNEDYFSLLYEVRKYFNCKRKKIYYLPHRREDENKLHNLEEKLGWQIIKPDVPIELFLLREKILPSEITGFMSTALFSLSILFIRSNIKLYSFYLSDKILMKRQKEIKTLYEFGNSYFPIFYFKGIELVEWKNS